METIHTPGPWRACNDGDCPCGQVWSTAEDSLVAQAVCESDNKLGEACRVADKSDEFKANARLIAAGPEMLESLQNLVGVFDHPAGWLTQNPMQKEALALARQAISKAILGKSKTE